MDLKKLEKSITYVERLASGNNPVNNLPLNNDTVLNDPNVVRCMYFIKEILKEVYNNNGIIGKRNKRATKPFPYEILKLFKYEEDKTISKLIKQINDLITDTEVEKIKVINITKWLKFYDYLHITEMEEYPNLVTIVTDKGKEIGLYNKTCITAIGRKYISVVYNKNAQEFIINNLKRINNEINSDEELLY